MIESPSTSVARRVVGRSAFSVLVIALLALAFLVAVPGLAAAGQAASGELFFYPCTSCHPVTMVPGAVPGTEQPSKRLPNGFKGHEIVLVGHVALGKGSVACLVCHDDPSRNPGKLKLADGTLVDIKGDVALVCYRCHSTKYKEWKAGTHGKHKGKCTAQGCHDPHTPQFIYADPLRPFVGNGFQFKVLSARTPFTPLARPAPAPPVRIPWWFTASAYLGLIVVGGLTGGLVMGRRGK
jgi:hypothetical protein